PPATAFGLGCRSVLTSTRGTGRVQVGGHAETIDPSGNSGIRKCAAGDFFTGPGGKTPLTDLAARRRATMTREALCDGQEEVRAGWERPKATANKAVGQNPRPPGDGRRHAAACRRAASPKAPGHPLGKAQ